MEDIQGVLQRGVRRGGEVLDRRDARLSARTRVGQRVFQGGPCLQVLTPGGTRAIVGLVPEEPGHARGFDADQRGTAVEEDLIEAADQDQRPALPIEVLQDASRRDPGGLDPASECAASGAYLRAQDQGQQVRIWLRLRPMAAAVTVNSCCLLGGNSTVWANQSQSRAFSWRRC